jgi:hypothetical protein
VSHVFPANANVKHPEISVQLSGEDGNGFFIASRVRMALKKGWRARGGARGVLGRRAERRLQPPFGDLHGLGRCLMTSRARISGTIRSSSSGGTVLP